MRKHCYLFNSLYWIGKVNGIYFYQLPIRNKSMFSLVLTLLGIQKLWKISDIYLLFVKRRHKIVVTTTGENREKNCFIFRKLRKRTNKNVITMSLIKFMSVHRTLQFLTIINTHQIFSEFIMIQENKLNYSHNSLFFDLLLRSKLISKI